MSVKLSDFASGVTLTDTDHVVGYSNTNTGGERKWTVANLRNSLITGAATTIDTENLTGSRALISDASGKVAASSITSDELNRLDGVTSNIQGQINTKGPGTVTNVTGTAPISVTNGTTTPAISIAAATTLAAGVMSSTDKTRLDDASGISGVLSCNGSGDFSAAAAATTSVAGLMSSTDKTRLDDASGVNGLVKCNGSGNFSAAAAADIPGIPDAKGLIKAYVIFNRSGFGSTILESYNVTSIDTTDSTGVLTEVNFASGTFSNANYGCSAITFRSNSGTTTGSQSFSILNNSGYIPTATRCYVEGPVKESSGGGTFGGRSAFAFYG
jgi:hypothetical protein